MENVCFVMEATPNSSFLFEDLIMANINVAFI
jgi:hypothetical protein